MKRIIIKLLLLSLLNLSSYMSFFKKYLVRNTIYIILISIIIVNFSYHRWVKDKSVITWDIKSYYAYLTAVFIYKDLSLEFRKDNIEKFGDLIWPVKTLTGKDTIWLYNNKYSNAEQ